MRADESVVACHRPAGPVECRTACPEQQRSELPEPGVKVGLGVVARVDVAVVEGSAVEVAERLGAGLAAGRRRRPTVSGRGEELG